MRNAPKMGLHWKKLTAVLFRNQFGFLRNFCNGVAKHPTAGIIGESLYSTINAMMIFFASFKDEAKKISVTGIARVEKRVNLERKDP